MKKILLLGDSITVGDWNKEEKRFRLFYETKKDSYVAYPYLDKYLDDLGYAFVNSSLGASSNLYCLQRLLDILHIDYYSRATARFLHPDYICINLTEPFRDIRQIAIEKSNDRPMGNFVTKYIKDADTILDNPSKSLTSINKELTYLYMKNIIKISEFLNIPIIFIEGLGKTHGFENKIKNKKIRFIKSWYEDYMEGSVPIITTYQTLNSTVEKYSNKKIQHENELNDLISYYEKFSRINNPKTNDNMTDSVHLHKKCLFDLANKIHEEIENYESIDRDRG